MLRKMIVPPQEIYDIEFEKIRVIYLLDNVSGLSSIHICLPSNNNDNEHWVEFEIFCCITGAKNMTTVFF